MVELCILSTLIKNINPKQIYEIEFNGKVETKVGQDWKMIFISNNKQISSWDGNILIQYFKNPEMVRETPKRKRNYKQLNNK